MKVNVEKLKNLNYDLVLYYFKYILLAVSMISAVILFNNTLVRTFVKLMFVVSVAIIAYGLYYRRDYFKNKNYIFLILFAFAYALTIILNVRSHIINEILLFGYTLMFFFAVTCQNPNMSKKRVQKELFNLAYLVIVLSLVLSSINLILFGVEEIGHVDFSEVTFLHHFGNSNQLGGLYNPNTGSMINLVSIIFSLIFILEKKQNVNFHIANVTLQTICFSLCQSRGSWVCLITYLLVYCFFIYKNGLKTTWVQRGIRFFCILLFCVGLSFLTRHAVYGIVHLASGTGISETEDLDRKEIEREDLNGFSTGRSGLWAVGIEAWKEKPVLGIGYRNIDDAFKAKLSKYDYKNSAKGGLHSTYVTTLVSVGAVGMILFILFLIQICFKGLHLLTSTSVTDLDKMFLSIVPMILVGDLVESRILFGMNFVCVVFWIMMGYVFYLDRKMKTND